jgi:CheY-like chemotaxis protein
LGHCGPRFARTGSWRWRTSHFDGITAFRQIRDDPATAMIPAIAVTASAMTQDRKTIMAAGFPRLEPRSLQNQDPIDTIFGP